ncbi:hypothetical protein C0061_12045, partial [Bordetella pertussis]
MASGLVVVDRYLVKRTRGSEGVDGRGQNCKQTYRASLAGKLPAWRNPEPSMSAPNAAAPASSGKASA